LAEYKEAKKERRGAAAIYPFLARRDSERKDDARINRQCELTAPNCSLSRREISLRLGVKREIMLLAARRTHATPEKATVLF